MVFLSVLKESNELIKQNRITFFVLFFFSLSSYLLPSLFDAAVLGLGYQDLALAQPLILSVYVLIYFAGFKFIFLREEGVARKLIPSLQDIKAALFFALLFAAAALFTLIIFVLLSFLGNYFLAVDILAEAFYERYLAFYEIGFSLLMALPLSQLFLKPLAMVSGIKISFKDSFKRLKGLRITGYIFLVLFFMSPLTPEWGIDAPVLLMMNAGLAVLSIYAFAGLIALFKIKVLHPTFQTN